jgi:uncharacterized protein
MATFANLASAHGRNWASDSRYRWAWYVWPQAASVVAAIWLLMGAPGAPQGEWSKPWQNTGAEMDALRDQAKTDPAALDRLKRLAEAGDPFAQFDYATLFDPDFKFTNTQDVNTAMEWYLKAANQGNGSAQANYGARLYDGLYGVPVDYDKAFPWLLQGAQQGDMYAQRRVGESFKYGRGTKEDPKLAVQWFHTAADQGDAYSQAEMGDAYADGNGVDQNMTDALAWYRKAADQKEDWAERQLGIIYLYGKNGVPRDPATAFEYLKESADAGNMGAQYYLGYMYDQGIFVQKDVRAALELYSKSADQGFADAQNVMGLAYWKGIGVPKDLAIARDWFKKAVENGSKEASGNLAALGGAPQQAAPTPSAPATPAAPAPGASAEAANPCLNEQNPRTALGLCQVFLGNNSGLGKTTLAAAYSKLAWASLQLGDYSGALSWSQKSLAIMPIASQHYIAGEAEAGLKDSKKAIGEFNAAIELAPKYVLAFQRRGEAYLALGDSNRAKEDFKSALAIDPNFKPAQEAISRLGQ